VGSGGERVFIRLGPPPEEPNQFGSALNQAGGRLSYSPEVRARLEVDAKEIIGRYPNKRSALLPLLHLVQSEDSYLTPAGLESTALDSSPPCPAASAPTTLDAAQARPRTKPPRVMRQDLRSR
jgi:hypothetical protein